MELALNIAWALCSLGLIWLWVRTAPSRSKHPIPRTAQALSLLMVVLLLLPVISLSDDLVAAQGLAETDCCVRRALQSHELHPSVVPASLAVPEQEFAIFALNGLFQTTVQIDGQTAPTPILSRSLDNRPPPRA
jgi:hypothetical protein